MDDEVLMELNNSFKEIDKKVDYINKNRYICDELIREKNSHIDIDFVKQSELIENNPIKELKGIHINNAGYKVLTLEPYFPYELLKIYKNDNEFETGIDYYADELDEFKDQLVNFKSKCSLLIRCYDENQKLNNEFIYKTPSHLKALNFALQRARHDRRKSLSPNRHPHELTDEFICFLNGLITVKSYEEFGPFMGLGEYRYTAETGEHMNVEIEGAKFKTTDSSRVKREMNDLIDEFNHSKLHPILKALIFKVKFVKIHPFYDGNGRTSRILLNYMLVREGYPTITIKNNQKEKYFEMLENAIVYEDFSGLINFVKDALNTRCDKYIELINENMQQNNI